MYKKLEACYFCSYLSDPRKLLTKLFMHHCQNPVKLFLKQDVL